VKQTEVLSDTVSNFAMVHHKSVLTDEAALCKAHLEIKNLKLQIEALAAINQGIQAEADKTEESLRDRYGKQIEQLEQDHNEEKKTYRAEINRLHDGVLFWQDAVPKLLKGTSVLVLPDQNTTILAPSKSRTVSIGQPKTKLVKKIKEVWHRTKWFFSLLGSLVLGALKRHTWSKTQVVEGTNLFLSGIPFFAKPAKNTRYISLTEKFEYRFLKKEMRNAVVRVPVKDFEPINSDQIRDAVEKIETALEEGKEVVLFSKAGVRRSAAVAIAYLMKKEKESIPTKEVGVIYKEALSQITASRPQTSIEYKTRRAIYDWFNRLPTY
jgi:hypothetical protein